MGRITIFSTDDLHSKHVLFALKQRSLPHVEVSLVQDPSRVEDIQALASQTSSPQVFFNTRCVGGVRDLLKELKRWDKTSSKYKTPLARYEAEIGSQHDPINERFSTTSNKKKNHHHNDGNPDFPSSSTAISETAVSDVSLLYARICPPSLVLPDGTMTCFSDMIEKLRNTITLSEISHKNSKTVVYLNSFRRSTAIATIIDSLEVSETEAIRFGESLCRASIFAPVEQKELSSSSSSAVSSSSNFRDSSVDGIYRLQPDMTPDVLNSYCIWKDQTASTSSTNGKSRRTAEQVLDRLVERLNHIETEAITKDGKLDHEQVRHSPHFPDLEEAVCELQVVGKYLESMNQKQVLAFGLNLYNFMMRFALIKVGVYVGESDYMTFMSTVKFNVGGHTFTFQEWKDGILRCNAKGRFTRKRPFAENDPRLLKIASPQSDCRIHFAMNCGSWMGSQVSLPFPKFTAENIDQQLNLAALVFCEDDCNIRINSRDAKIYISNALMWYRHDFAKKDKEMVQVIGKYLQGNKKFNWNKAQRQAKINTNKNRSIVKVLSLPDDYTRNACNFIEFNETELRNRISGVKAIFRRFAIPRKHPDELLRLSVVQSLNLLDTLPQERFDRLTRMAQATFNVPLVFVTLVDEHRTWHMSMQWQCPLPAVKEAGREVSFCSHAILQGKDEVFEIPDCSKHPNFADHPFVREGFSLRYYAGANLSLPATNAEGGKTVNIGTLCLFDFKPRKLDEGQRNMLKEYASLVRDEILRGQLLNEDDDEEEDDESVDDQ